MNLCNLLTGEEHLRQKAKSLLSNAEQAMKAGQSEISLDLRGQAIACDESADFLAKAVREQAYQNAIGVDV